MRPVFLNSSLLISATVDGLQSPQAKRMLVTKALPHDVANLACSFARSWGVFSSCSCTCRFAFGAEKHLLCPQKSPPALQSTNIDDNYHLGWSISSLTWNHSCLSNEQWMNFLATHFMDCSGKRPPETKINNINETIFCPKHLKQ